MEFRKSEYRDIEKILEIIEGAKAYLKEEKIDQWQMGYPNRGSIKDDIDNNESYVLEDRGKILATTALSFREEEDYKRIYDGKWLTEKEYGVIHRIAVDMDLKGKNIANQMMKKIEGTCLDNNIFSIKVDTHRKNIAMKRFLEKNGFKYCGIIYLKDASERLAYEKILKE